MFIFFFVLIILEEITEISEESLSWLHFDARKEGESLY